MGWFTHSTQKILGSVVNYRVDKWVDLPYLKSTSYFIIRQTKNLFSKEKAPLHAEDFDEAKARLNLNEEDLIQQYKQYKKLFLFFCYLSFLLFFYSLYLIYRSNFKGVAMTLAITLYGFSHAFRYHFWMYQIKRKKLGCSFKEWFFDLYRLNHHRENKK